MREQAPCSTIIVQTSAQTRLQDFTQNVKKTGLVTSSLGGGGGLVQLDNLVVFIYFNNDVVIVTTANITCPDHCLHWSGQH